MDDNLTLLAETKLKMEILREDFEQWEGGSDITNSISINKQFEDLQRLLKILKKLGKKQY